MSKNTCWLIFLLVVVTGVLTLSDDPNPGGGSWPSQTPGGNWPTPPIWMPGSSQPNQQHPAQNQTNVPFGFGAYPPYQGQNMQNTAMGWPTNFAFNPFGQNNPFGFAQPIPAPIVYGGFGNQGQPVSMGMDTTPSLGENEPSVSLGRNSAEVASGSGDRHQPVQVNAEAGSSRRNDTHRGPTNDSRVAHSRWRSPSRERDRRHSEISDAEVEEDSEESHGKGKRRASRRLLERSQALEEQRRRREEDEDVERARRRAERAPIPQDVLDLQAREMGGGRRLQSDETANALREQISLTMELTRRCNELEKMLSKRQLSPAGHGGQPPKRMRETRANYNDRRRAEADFDEFLDDDDEYSSHRRGWNPRGRERERGGFPYHNRESHMARGPYMGRGRDFANHSRPTRQPADVVTDIPRRVQHLPEEDRHDERLDSYDQRRFGHVIADERMGLEERMTDLSLDLPAMPLRNGSYANQDEADDTGPRNSVQQARLFVERRNLRLRHPGRLPTWHHEVVGSAAGGRLERDNSFRGMYGPGFAYDPRTNVIYADREAVDAARTMVDGVEVPIPDDMHHRPNPRGFPMNVREVQESIHCILGRRPRWQATLRLLCEFHCISESVVMRYRDLAMHEVIEQFERDERLLDLRGAMPPPYFVPLDPRYRRTGNGSLAGGAGLVSPINGSLDDWCQYTAHHFCPGGLNPTSGIIMDASHRVSYASVWGMVLLRFLHPANAKNFYARYFVGIVFRPRYYVDFIRNWNRDRTEELPISVAVGTPVLRRMVFNGAGENLSELDVIRHLASCAVTQEMLDNAYLWALVWIDQHTSVHFREHYRQLEGERQDRLQRFGEPAMSADLRGWWSPDVGDTHRIRALTYYERYEYLPTGCVHTQDNPYWLLRGESPIFRWLNEFPPSESTPPPPSVIAAPDTDVPMTPESVNADDADNVDIDTDDDGTPTAEAAPSGAVDDADMDAVSTPSAMGRRHQSE